MKSILLPVEESQHSTVLIGYFSKNIFQEEFSPAFRMFAVF